MNIYSQVIYYHYRASSRASMLDLLSSPCVILVFFLSYCVELLSWCSYTDLNNAIINISCSQVHKEWALHIMCCNSNQCRLSQPISEFLSAAMRQKMYGVGAMPALWSWWRTETWCTCFGSLTPTNAVKTLSAQCGDYNNPHDKVVQKRTPYSPISS